MQDTLSEGTHTRSAAGTFSGERSPPARSEDLPPEMWLPTLSDDERLLYAARSRVLSSTSRLYYYIKCTCHMPHKKKISKKITGCFPHKPSCFVDACPGADIVIMGLHALLVLPACSLIVTAHV
jgi:hypothetical protein